VVVIFAAVMIGAMLAMAGAKHSAPAQPASVTSFNDGWRTGMQDACQQHDSYACHWLAVNK
jgi:ABC-type sugar transport system substrate-binding protein